MWFLVKRYAGMLFWVFLLLGGIGLGAWKALSREKPAPPVSVAAIKAERGMPVTVVTAEKGYWESWISLYGRVQTANPHSVASDRQEYALTVDVNVGDRVTKGQVLVTLDTRTAAQNMAALRARSAEAQAQYERLRSLHAAGGTSMREVESAFAAAQDARARLAESQTGLSRHKVTAPVGGIVLSRTVEPGELVSPGKSLFVVADLDDLEAVMDVAPGDLPRIPPNPKVMVRSHVNGWVDARFKRLDPQADVTTGLYAAVFSLPSGSGLLPGAVVEGQLRLLALEDAVSLPYEAVRPLATRHVVYVVSGDVAEEREVRIDDTRDNRTRIVFGLEGGERVVFKGAERLFPGAKIWIQGQ